MTSFSARYNKGRKFDIDTTNFEFESLVDLYNNNGADKVYSLRGLYINTKSQFGDSPVAATDKFFVDFPKHMLDVVKEILNDEEAVAFINEKGVGFQIYPYIQKKYKKQCYGINFVDLK